MFMFVFNFGQDFHVKSNTVNLRGVIKFK